MEHASSTSKQPQMYDVLINFTGEEIRRKFVSHLDSALTSVGLTTFLHQENAVKEMQIQEPSLDLCRVAIVVFTKTYSQSAWCLHQLEQIIKWHEAYYRHVLPVYYEIQPSDVRLQKGDFGKSFKATAHQTFPAQQLEHGISRWSHALTKAADFFGWDESNYRSDAELVDKIVKSVLNLPVLSATKFPVGLQSYVEDVIRTIEDKSSQVCTIVICGMEGSGKSTIAKAIYNRINGTFTEKSFIEDVAQISQTRGYVHLQERLLSDVLKTKVKIRSVEMGRRMIRERLFKKRMLIVLDEYSPFLDLRKSRAWFGKGTVIIITTRNEDLPGIREVDSVLQINLMNPDESLELLSWHAFREPKPKEEYYDLAKAVAAYCGGLPLVLEVIGSTLFESTKEEWKSVLLELEKIHKNDVHHKLKISFDSLRSEMEKDLFLDVCCFPIGLCCFPIGKGTTYVMNILNVFGLDADSGIRVLIQRNLIKVKNNNKFVIHPLLQKMGRKISQQEFWREKRLQFDDAECLFTYNRGTKSAQSLPMKLRSANREPSTLLKLAGNSEYLPKKLRWINLREFSSPYLLNDFYLDDAIAIDLKHSLLRVVWKKPQVLMWLRVLNLSHSKNLTETPDFSGLPSLEQLILKYCTGLRKVHKSIGCLCNLILLNLKDCTSLSKLPREIYELTSLRTLILSGCSKIHLLEKDVVQMGSLITLIAENTTVKHVPFSILSSKSIGHISLRGFERLPRNLFLSIIRSWMSPVMNTISYIHSFCMDNGNCWDDIAPLLSSLTNLRSVLVQCDTEFQLCKQVKNILVEYFTNFTESQLSKRQFRSPLIGLGTYHKFLNAVSDNISKALARRESSDVSLPADNDPYWLAHMGDGHSVSFIVPPNRYLKGMALFVVYVSIPGIVATACLRSVLIVNYTKFTMQIHNHGTLISFNDIDWQSIRSNLGSGDKVEIFLNFGHGLIVKNTYVYFLSGESNYFEKEPAPKKNSLLRFIKKIVM